MRFSPENAVRRIIFAVITLLLAADAFSQSVPGCSNGRLTDPRAYFSSVVAGTNSSQYEAVLAAKEPLLLRYGIWLQRTSGGQIRGRLFIPYAAAGYVPAPPFYEHAVDVVGATTWVWEDRGGPAYAPYPCGTEPPPPPPPPPPPAPDLTEVYRRLDVLDGQVVALRTADAAIQNEAAALSGRVTILESKKVYTECRAALAGIPISCRLQ